MDQEDSDKNPSPQSVNIYEDEYVKCTDCGKVYLSSYPHQCEIESSDTDNNKAGIVHEKPEATSYKPDDGLGGIGDLLSETLFSGIRGGLAFLFLKFSYGIYHDYGATESFDNLFTPYGVIVFGIGFVAGVVYPFLDR